MSKATKILIALLLTVTLALSFGAGCVLGNQTPTVADQGLDKVEEVWNIIFQDYVDKDRLDGNALSEGAIKGMLEALDDPYTSYMDAETYELAMSSMEGKFEGIGAQVSMKDEQLMIIAPIADSPAEKAGIRAGDIILEINGRSTTGMSLAEAVLIIRGPKGTPVTLLIRHQEETEPETIEVVRAEIELPSVRYEMKGDIAYVNITYFSEYTNDELSPVMQSISEEAATGLVLDLSSNPGGLLKTVVDVTSRFLEEGVVVIVVDNQGKRTTLTVNTSETTTTLPMVVLVDSYSASGAEVLSGALQDHERAIIAGTKTYGKGSVNILRRLNDGSGLYITTSRWLTPNGRLIEGEGLIPDRELELSREEAIQWAIDYLHSNQ